jgi:hypothetical protein
MPTGGGGTRPADAGPATASCRGRHPQAPAGSVADTSRPDTNRLHTDLLDTDRGSGSSSGQPRRPRCPVPQPPRHRPQGPAAAGWRRTRSPVAAPGQDRAGQLCSSALVKWSGRRSQRSGCPNAWTPDAACRTPGARTPRHCGHPRPPQGMGTLQQRPRWTAGSRTVHHPATVSDWNGTPMCGIGHHARLTARSVGWCSTSTQCPSVLSVLLRSVAESSQYQRIHLVTPGGLPRGLPQADVGVSRNRDALALPCGSGSGPAQPGRRMTSRIVA